MDNDFFKRKRIHRNLIEYGQSVEDERQVLILNIKQWEEMIIEARRDLEFLDNVKYALKNHIRVAECATKEAT